MTQHQARRLADDILQELRCRFIRPRGYYTIQIRRENDTEYAVFLCGEAITRYGSREEWLENGHQIR